MNTRLNRLGGKLFSLVITTIIFTTSLYPQAVPSNYKGVMLQGFYWDSFDETSWSALNDQADEISDYFNLIWLPPSGNAQGSQEHPNMGYHPVWYFDQNSCFGTAEELQSLILNLKDRGCGAIADIVINHRNGVSNWTNFPTETYKEQTYTWGLETICKGDEVKDQPEEGVPTGNDDTGENWSGARDIDHTNPIVQATIDAYLDFMKNEMGYIGWRYDFVKGFDPSYVAKYSMNAETEFSVGECWDGYDRTVQWINGTTVGDEIRSGAFDFELKYALRDACNSGEWNKLMWKYNGTNPQPAGLVHSPEYKKYAYTFVDNHDTYEVEADKLNNNIGAANAFILTHPGVPCIFYPHWRDHKEEIKKLIDIRRIVGIDNESNVTVKESANDVYVAEVSGSGGSLIIKVGSRYNYNPPSEYSLKASGDNYAIWTTTAQEGTISSSVDPIIPNMETTITYDGTGTNFANWSPLCHIHAWLEPKAGETFSQNYNPTWSTCEGDEDYAALDDKVKMNKIGEGNSGKYSINLNIQDFFNVSDEDLNKIAKLGIIVRTQYDEGSMNNKTIDFVLNVAAPAAVYEGFSFNYGLEDQEDSWVSIPLVIDEESGYYAAPFIAPDSPEQYICYVAYNGGIGDPVWVEGKSSRIGLTSVEGFSTEDVIVSVSRSSEDSNWGLFMTPDLTTGINHEKRDEIICLGGINSVKITSENKIEVQIYSVSGVLLNQLVIEGSRVMDGIDPGIYLIKINDETHKVIVK